MSCFRELTTAFSYLLLIVGFVLFGGSTPYAVYKVFYESRWKADQDTIHFWAIANSYGFSVGMLLIWLHPFVNLGISFIDRLRSSLRFWIIILTCFTEIAFQLPHSLCTSFLERYKGQAVEWPFQAYGLSDSRWTDYNPQSFYVYLINMNDATLGILVLLAFLFYNFKRTLNAYIPFAIVLLFRDATLFRETVEYLWDHHRLDYPFTTTDSVYRTHAITCLWLVNIAWIIAPLLTVYWVYCEMMTIVYRQVGSVRPPASLPADKRVKSHKE